MDNHNLPASEFLPAFCTAYRDRKRACPDLSKKVNKAFYKQIKKTADRMPILPDGIIVDSTKKISIINAEKCSLDDSLKRYIEMGGAFYELYISKIHLIADKQGQIDSAELKFVVPYKNHYQTFKKPRASVFRGIRDYVSGVASLHWACMFQAVLSSQNVKLSDVDVAVMDFIFATQTGNKKRELKNYGVKYDLSCTSPSYDNMNFYYSANIERRDFFESI